MRHSRSPPAQALPAGALDKIRQVPGNEKCLDCGAVEPDWGDVQSIPSDIADGDDDSLAGLGCADGEVVGWDGSDWVCTSIAVTAQLSESDVEGYIENGPVELVQTYSLPQSAPSVSPATTDADAMILLL